MSPVAKWRDMLFTDTILVMNMIDLNFPLLLNCSRFVTIHQWLNRIYNIYICLSNIYDAVVISPMYIHKRNRFHFVQLTIHYSVLTNITIFIHIFEEHLRGSVHSNKLTRDTCTYHVMLIYCYLIWTSIYIYI
mgnify:CR=1 FL=1